MIHYITTNADTGSGTLRSLLAEASDGDVIELDSTIFPAGTDCVITLASYLTINKGVTIRGAQGRIRLVGNYVMVNTGSSSSANGKRVTFEDVSFEKMSRTTYGPVAVQYVNYCDFIRCRWAGCSGPACGALYVLSSNSNTTVSVVDSAAYGNRCTNSTGQVATFWYNAATTVSQKATMRRCTYGGDATRTSGASGAFRYTPTTISDYVSPSYEADWVVPPPEYTYANWTNTLWESMDPRLVSTSAKATGCTTTAEWDLLGNPRRSGGAQGAFETYALYWIGKDSAGSDVTTGSYDSSVGWATSPIATTSGPVVPTTVANVCVAANATITGSYEGDVYIAHDITASLEVGGFVVAGKNAEVSLVINGGLELENTTFSAPSLTIAAWSYLKVVNSTINCDTLIIYGALITNSSITVKRLEARDGAYIKMSEDRIFVTATESAYFGDALFEGGKVSYVFVPPTTDYGDAKFDETVKPGYYGAGLASVSFNRGTLTWTANDLTHPVLIEIERDGKASVYTHQATGGSKIVNAEYQFGDYAKAFVVDGENALSVDMPTTASKDVLDI